AAGTPDRALKMTRARRPAGPLLRFIGGLFSCADIGWGSVAERVWLHAVPRRVSEATGCVPFHLSRTGADYRDGPPGCNSGPKKPQRPQKTRARKGSTRPENGRKT